MSQNDSTSPVSMSTVKEVGSVTRWVLRRVGQNRVATPLVLAGLTAAAVLTPEKQQEEAGAAPSADDPGKHHSTRKQVIFAGGSALTLSAIAFGPKAKRMLDAAEKGASQAL